MYSVVLMAALTTGGNTADFGRSRCYGCYSACYGCHNACNGCACAGRNGGYGSYGSYYGGCFGCFGAYQSYGCHACNGGWWNTYRNGFWWQGAIQHGPPHAFCWGCFGCYGCYGAGHGYIVVEPARPEVVPVPKEEKKGDKKDDKKNGKGGEEPVQANRARLVVDVPTDAKVYIDGYLMRSNATTRVFSTPELQPGQTYFYDLRAEVTRDGQPISQTQRVVLRPGQTVRAAFSELTAPTATAARSD